MILKNRLGHKMSIPHHLVHELAAAEILIHLEHYGPMNLNQLYGSLNPPNIEKRISFAVMQGAVQVLQRTGLAKRLPGPVNRKKTLYAMIPAEAAVEVEECLG